MRYIAVVGLMLLSLTLWSCGSSLECGPGTTSKDGECRPTASACGEDTKLVEGACVPESKPVECAAGTIKKDGKCEPEVTCGPDTQADAQGKCVPVYDEVTCGRGTQADGDTCVENVFQIDSIQYPDTIQSSQQQGDNRKPVELTWSGNAMPPFTAKFTFDQNCPSGRECNVGSWTGLDGSNPIVIQEALGCYGASSNIDFELVVFLTDVNGVQSNAVSVDWTCIGN